VSIHYFTFNQNFKDLYLPIQDENSLDQNFDLGVEIAAAGFSSKIAGVRLYGFVQKAWEDDVADVKDAFGLRVGLGAKIVATGLSYAFPLNKAGILPELT
jgi:hypothetical protein